MPDPLNGFLQTDLATDIAGLFDSVEGQDYPDVDTGTISFLVPGGKAGRLALVNSLDAPPMCCFPEPALDSAYEPTTTFVQRAYSYAQEPRRIVTAGDTGAKVVSPANVEWTGLDAAYTVSGWTVTKHSHEVDNDEDAFEVRMGTHALAHVRPWRGWFSILPFGVAGGAVSIDHGPNDRHYRVHLEGGTVWIADRGNLHGSGFLVLDTGIAAEHASVRVDRFHRQSPVVLVTQPPGGGVQMRTSLNGGETFGAMTTVSATGEKSATAITAGGLRHIVWIDGAGMDEVWRRTFDRGGNEIIAASMIRSGVDNDSLALLWTPNAGGKGILSLHVYEGGALVEYVSDDGGYVYA